jgi:hypothetical protein
LPVVESELQPEFVTFDRTRNDVETFGDVVLLQALWVEPFLQRVRLAAMTEGIAIPNASWTVV